MGRRAWLAFAAVSAIWGVPYLFIKIAVRNGLPPATLAWGRDTLAAVLLLAMRFDHSERPTPLRAVGLAIGFAGVVALVGIDVAGRGGELLGTRAILVAAVGYAIGPMVIKHGLLGLDPRATMGASLAISSLLLAPAALLDPPRSVPSAGR